MRFPSRAKRFRPPYIGIPHYIGITALYRGEALLGDPYCNQITLITLKACPPHKTTEKHSAETVPYQVPQTDRLNGSENIGQKHTSGYTYCTHASFIALNDSALSNQPPLSACYDRARRLTSLEPQLFPDTNSKLFVPKNGFPVVKALNSVSPLT